MTDGCITENLRLNYCEPILKSSHFNSSHLSRENKKYKCRIKMTFWPITFGEAMEVRYCRRFWWVGFKVDFWNKWAWVMDVCSGAALPNSRSPKVRRSVLVMGFRSSVSNEVSDNVAHNISPFCRSLTLWWAQHLPYSRTRLLTPAIYWCGWWARFIFTVLELAARGPRSVEEIWSLYDFLWKVCLCWEEV